ncbi:tRNA (adenosine(37)-N6)-dimethylallyltransferase MiaA [Desulfopila inferna]|nr:tRNA (adenosine(37)-N6)-dimethylallyltransferase MiaA [Desulfopila inferna]MBM9602839.1 tRNA (adenosine(37)-N6)-dimethylallyltransferase MiaA [Desulfopila inferna]
MTSSKFPIKAPVIVLVGPTAIGKTALSLEIADRFGCEIVSLDSMQIYRHMDIGTAKVSPQEREHTTHHLIDVVNPDEHYDASDYVRDALEAIVGIHQRKKIPVVTGGTGLYLRALIEGLFKSGASFPELREELHRRLETEGSSKLHEELLSKDRITAQKIHKNDTHRLIRALEIYHGTGKSWSDHIAGHAREKGKIRFEHIIRLGLTCERELLYRRINERTSLMLRQGLREEVLKLLAHYHRDLKSMQSIGYRHMAEHLLDGTPIEKTEELLARDTRRYAKRQYTWFKKMNIEWFETASHRKIITRIQNFLG